MCRKFPEPGNFWDAFCHSAKLPTLNYRKVPFKPPLNTRFHFRHWQFSLRPNKITVERCKTRRCICKDMSSFIQPWTRSMQPWTVLFHKYIYICLYIHTYIHTYIHYITLHYITLHYITLHYITLHYITSHHITSHHITLHYIHTYC